MSAGYSGTPLAKKLGLKDGMRVAWVARPPSQDGLVKERAFADVAETATAAALPPGPYDLIHLFTDSRAALETALPQMLDRLARDGMIWVSWPKKASKVPTDVTEDVIRALALQTVLVDVKVCAVDSTWSGLKLVIRKDLR